MEKMNPGSSSPSRASSTPHEGLDVADGERIAVRACTSASPATRWPRRNVARGADDLLGQAAGLADERDFAGVLGFARRG